MSDDDDNEFSEELDTGVQLGFVTNEINPLFLDFNWRDWDGGKVGGKPIWLDPINIPSLEDLSCGKCGSLMSFLLQLYCPLDEVKDAFHRSLYVFVCKRKVCVEQGSIKCFRCQLGRENTFYSYDPDIPDNVLDLKTRTLCTVCGFRAPFMCSKCKKACYCSRLHQKSHWKWHKSVCSIDDGESDPVLILNDGLLFEEHELAVSDEVLVDYKEDAFDQSVMNANIWEGATEAETGIDDDDDEEEDEDAALTQTDYNKALGNDDADDEVYSKFVERVRRGGGDQVLRYSRWDDNNGPLRLSDRSEILVSISNTDTSSNMNNVILDEMSEANEIAVDELSINAGDITKESASIIAKPTVPIPHCPYCGAEQKFEFQIMPQLLHYLRVDKNSKLGDDAKAKSLIENGSIDDTNNSRAVNDSTKEENHELPKELECISDSNIIENIKDEDIDWGTIDIYTCTASCSPSTQLELSGESSSYLLETVQMQTPVLFHRRRKL